MKDMKMCFVLLHHEAHLEDLIPEPYLSIIILAIVVVFVIFLIVNSIRKIISAGRNRNNPELETDEEYVSNLIETKRKRDEEKYVGDKSTAIPKVKTSQIIDQTIWEDEKQ
jgi:hypothetical protein